MYKKFLIPLFLFANIILAAQQLNIGLFYNDNIKTFTLTSIKGDYELQHNEVIKGELKEGEIIYVTIINEFMQIRKQENLIGTYKSISFIGKSKENYFSIKAVLPDLPARIYDDNLTVAIKDSVFKLVNKVDIDKYIAGVVESEAGPTSELEFYKSQAVICRTYTYKNINRHYDENFNLCDGVHCQAYKGRSFYNNLIPKAAISTNSLIIVDSLYQPIDAAFHSNSGGQTANSEDVWVSGKYYLRSKTDPFSLTGKSYNWYKNIPLEEWIKYLKENNFTIPYNYNADYFNFNQIQRLPYYKAGNDSIRFTKIRADLNLRSSFFSVKADSSNILLNGKGYGHGVGLSQEGGMEMAKQGENFENIVHFYFQNVKIISFKELNKITGAQ